MFSVVAKQSRTFQLLTPVIRCGGAWKVVKRHS